MKLKTKIKSDDKKDKNFCSNLLNNKIYGFGYFRKNREIKTTAEFVLY